MSLHITNMHANDKWGMDSTKTQLTLLCIFQFCFFQLLLLHLLQRVSNPPSRHACPSVRRFANSAPCLWRRSLMKTTCTHSHAHPNKHQLSPRYHLHCNNPLLKSSLFSLTSFFSRCCMLLLVTLYNFNTLLTQRLQQIWSLVTVITLSYRKSHREFFFALSGIREQIVLKHSGCVMAIPYPAKHSQLDQHKLSFCKSTFPPPTVQHLETIVPIRHDAKCGDRAQAVQAKPQERAPLRPQPQTSPAPVTTTMI